MFPYVSVAEDNDTRENTSSFLEAGLISRQDGWGFRFSFFHQRENSLASQLITALHLQDKSYSSFWGGKKKDTSIWFMFWVFEGFFLLSRAATTSPPLYSVQEIGG